MRPLVQSNVLKIASMVSGTDFFEINFKRLKRQQLFISHPSASVFILHNNIPTD